MTEPSLIVFFIIFELHDLKSSVTSKTSFFKTFSSLRFLSLSDIKIKPCCLFASYSIIFSNWSSCCTPFTSTTPLPITEIFTSCRIDPIPLVTFFVIRSNLPNASAIFFISDGLTSTGSRAISTRGTPNRSKLYDLSVSLSLMSLAASSSRHKDCTPTRFPSTSRCPP